MSTIRSAPVSIPNSAGLAICIMKRVDSVSHVLKPTALQAGLDALSGFRFKDRLSYDEWIALVTATPGLLFGGVYVVAFPNDLNADIFVTNTLFPNTILIGGILFFADSDAELTNLFAGSAARKTGHYIGGVYDPQTLGGMMGGSLPLSWP